MSEHLTHPNHSHTHGPSCGHKSVTHDGHTDYLHDGHLHRVHGDHIDECTVEVTQKNPAGCTANHACGGHDKTHQHGPGCGHEAVPHGGHTDYLVSGHLHHPHADHCDNHGALA